MEERSGWNPSSYGLENHGLKNINRAYWNLSAGELYEHAIRRGEGRIGHLGPLVVNTGPKPIRQRDGTRAIGQNDIVTNQVFGVIYDLSSDTWRMVSVFGLDEVTTAISTDATTNSAPIYEAYRQAQIVLSQNIGNYRSIGQNTSGVKTTLIDEYCNVDAVTLGAESASKQWQTMQAGSLAFRMKLGAGLSLGNPSGGDKGTGTLNATGVYDDNVLLTCYPLAMAIHGQTSPVAWDAGAHRRGHKAARRFLKRWQDWLDPKTYAAFWRERGHLPAMPSPREWQERDQSIPLGELLQRLWETVDTQAVHIDRLRQQIEELEDAGRRDARGSDPSE